MNSRTNHRSKGVTTLSWTCQIVAAAILAQTLLFKFSGAEESVYIFRTLCVEPWGRYASGVMELLAAVLLLTPATAAVGGAMGVGIMLGAIGAHATRLGVSVKGDGGMLFGLAMTVLVSCAAVLWIRRAELPVVGRLVAAA